MAAGTDQLFTNEALRRGESLVSANKFYRLDHQLDGNLVLYKLYRSAPPKPLWSSATYGRPTDTCVLQTDGNLVLYNQAKQALWASNTFAANCRLILQNDGNLVLYRYRPDKVFVWSTNTPQPTAPDGPTAKADRARAGEILAVDQPLRSPNNRYTLVFQADGNLVLHDGAPTRPVWSTATTADTCVFQTDGNLVLYDRDCKPLWSTNTYGNPGSQLLVRDDGTLAVARADATLAWTTKPPRQYLTELHALNSAVVRGLGPDASASVDPELWRGSRVLVPISVQALVLNSVHQQRPWADVAVRRDAQNNLLAPPPFTDQPPRPAGVHLHWALPDALTRGSVAPGPDANPIFPLIPDRWLVVRLGWTADNTRRTITAWVVESEQPDPAKRVTPLSAWKETRPPNPAERALTAAGPNPTGSFCPTFTAVYDNVRGSLAFHDPLSDVTGAAKLGYLVVGWYSNPTHDPLFVPRTEHAWHERIKALRWSLTASDVGRAKIDAALLHRRAAEHGQPPRTDKFADASQIADAAAMLTANHRGTVYRVSEELLGPGANHLLNSSAFALYHPRQTLCHGFLYDVDWNPGTPTLSAAPLGVSLCAGNTGSEALACELAKTIPPVGEPADTLAEVDDRLRLFTAFQYGLLPLLSSPDGLASLDQHLHDQTFSSLTDGYTTEYIYQGDMSGETARAPEPQTPPAGESRIVVDLRFAPGDRSMVELASAARPAAAPAAEAAMRIPRTRPTERVPRLTPVRRARPRFFQPVDPTLLLFGPRRSFRFGEDGRFSSDGTLQCRLSRETITTLSCALKNPLQVRPQILRFPISGAAVRRGELASGHIPEEAAALLDEALLLDETNAPLIAAALVGHKRDYLKQQGFTDAQLDLIALATTIQTEQTLLHNATLNPDVDRNALLGLSGFDRTAPSMVAVERWKQAWNPIFLEWEATWHAVPELSGWTLGEVDHALKSAPPATPTATYAGRTILSPHIARTFQASIKRYLDDRAAARSSAALPDDVEEKLSETLAGWGYLDVAVATLDGLHDMLRGAAQVRYFNAADPTRPIDPCAGKPTFGLRAGLLRLTRVRIVDLFGQIYQLSAQELANLARPEDLRSADSKETGLVLPPRIPQASQLAFRLLHADAPDDATEADKQRGPVCGFVIPDHLDSALEVYDNEGTSLGQIQPAVTGSGVEWQGTPGLPTSWGKPPTLANRHLRGLVDGLLAWSPRDVQAGRDNNHSALAGLLNTVDAALWTVDPMGRTGSEHLSTLVGRPLAVVRARVRITCQAPVTNPDLARVALPVRLGLLTRLNDGLMGYFVDDDYSRFYPVHESLALQTRAAGRHEGFHGAINQVPTFYGTFASSPVNHPYIDPSPTLRLRIGQTARLTLLLDPRGGVHATSGVLPTKKIELMREHVARALDAIALTFRVGPVLSDPATIRMPIPKEIRGQWSWVRRTGVTVWNESPVVHASQDALVGKTPSELMEGWLRLTKAFAGEDTP